MDNMCPRDFSALFSKGCTYEQVVVVHQKKGNVGMLGSYFDSMMQKFKGRRKFLLFLFPSLVRIHYVDELFGSSSQSKCFWEEGILQWAYPGHIHVACSPFL